MSVTNDGFATENSTSSLQWVDQTGITKYQTEQILGLILCPCILVVGSFGNIATICVMRRIKDHNSSQHVILMGLAVSDFILVQTGMFYRIPRFYFHIDVRVWHSLVCKLFYWLLNVTQAMSAWFLTCVTMQRAMSIKWPHKMRAVCTLRRTRMVIASIAFSVCIIYSHILVGWEIDSDNRCRQVIVGYIRFNVYWDWVDMFIDSLIPSLCQIVCGVILCSALFKAASTMSVTVQGSSGVDTEHNQKRRRNTASRITVMCLALSAAFLILTLPVDLDELWYRFANVNLTPRSMAQRYLRYSVFNFLVYINSAVNFFLYCITGTKFRQEFVNWICCRSQRHFTASSGDVTTRAVKGRQLNN